VNFYFRFRKLGFVTAEIRQGALDKMKLLIQDLEKEQSNPVTPAPVTKVTSPSEAKKSRFSALEDSDDEEEETEMSELDKYMQWKFQDVIGNFILVMCHLWLFH
jgi:hypothetical protein